MENPDAIRQEHHAPSFLAKLIEPKPNNQTNTMKTASALLLSLTLAAPVRSEPSTNLPPPPGGFTLHEWGTFTSVSGSDGILLPGVERSEEALPSFTYAHEAMHHNDSIAVPFSKGIAWTRPLANVTVRMETPVIYFYTKEPFQARVDVGFKGGTISQWYPQRSGGDTLPALKRNEKGLPLLRGTNLHFIIFMFSHSLIVV